MATITALKNIIEGLDKNVATKKLMVIEVNRLSDNLVKTLEKSGHITVIKRTNKQIIIRPSPGAVCFRSVKTENVKKNKLLSMATAQLPAVTGSLLLYTRCGVMDHNSAVNNNIGGQVFGWCY